jgi:pantothenate kinase
MVAQALFISFFLLHFVITIAGVRSFSGIPPLARPTPQQVLERVDLGLLAARALDLLEQSGSAQVYIAVAGAPGSGKSSLALRLVNTINKLRNDSDYSILIPMDGYHLPQSQLLSLGDSGILIGDADASSGKTTSFDDLMKRRGAPWTFDPVKLHKDLASAKANGCGSFPSYDRSISDPIPDQIHVTTQNRIILCEGNYLLAFDDADWKALENIWDDTWLIDVPEAILQERLVRRHLQNWNSVKESRFGKGLEGALTKVEMSDLKNAQYVYRCSRPYANLILKNI